MAFRRFHLSLEGTRPLILSNPCTVDPLGPHAAAIKYYTGLKKNRNELIPGAKGHPDADSFVALNWLVGKLAAGKLPDTVEFYHAGKCGCCGRTLTVPESIVTGLGPVCAGRME